MRGSTHTRPGAATAEAAAAEARQSPDSIGEWQIVWPYIESCLRTIIRVSNNCCNRKAGVQYCARPAIRGGTGFEFGKKRCNESDDSSGAAWIFPVFRCF